MKCFLAAFALLVLALDASGECIEVLAKPLSSTQNLKVIVLLTGKPTKGAALEVFNGKAFPLFTVSTDSQGMANFWKLEPGNYVIYAKSSDGMAATLELQVSTIPGAKPSVFSMNLESKTNPSLLGIAKKMQNAEDLPIKMKSKTFSGIVLDPSGAGIPGTEVRIFQKGSRDSANATLVKADSVGHFSAQLPDGIYTAVFAAQAFVIEAVTIELSGEFEAKEMAVTLRVGGVSRALFF